MAPVILFRIAIALTPTAYRIVSSGQPAAGGAYMWLGEQLRRRLSDPDEDDAALSATASDAAGYSVSVATYEGTFELRKLHVLFSRNGGGTVAEDRAVITMHFLKLVAGAPDATWAAGDFTTIETALDTFLGVHTTQCVSTVLVDEYRWYRTGPQRDIELGAPGRTGPPVRVVKKNRGGGWGAPAAPLPPQVAISVTEQTSDKKAWGRFYLPGPINGANVVEMATGRIKSAHLTSLGNAADTFYEACRTANTPVVVYSSAKPERETAAGATLPARGARALTVDQLQLDDIFDVIR